MTLQAWDVGETVSGIIQDHESRIFANQEALHAHITDCEQRNRDEFERSIKQLGEQLERSMKEYYDRLCRDLNWMLCAIGVGLVSAVAVLLVAG